MGQSTCPTNNLKMENMQSGHWNMCKGSLKIQNLIKQQENLESGLLKVVK